jgi:hypothetical protein
MLKKGIGFGSRIANARNARNETIIGKAHLSRDWIITNKDYMLDIF